MMDTPRIYVADLAAYNAGTLRGVWIDATKEPDEIRAEVQAMLSRSPEPVAEEWRINDCEGFGGIHLSEWASFDEVHGIALLIEDHGALGAELLSNWYHDVDEVRRLFDDGCYLGAFGSVADYAQEITEETTEIPDHLKYYVDYASMARDMELNGDIFTIELGHEVNIFINH
jgi:antirestriction protein